MNTKSRARSIRSTFFILLVLYPATACLHAASWKFIVFGDCRGVSTANPVNTNIVMELGRACTNEKPAFVLVSGDLAYQGNVGWLQTWSNAMAPVYAAGIPVYPVRGNHELDGDPTAYSVFFAPRLPQNGPTGEKGLTYSVTYSNALILALDAYIVRHQVNTNWVKAVLATNTALHVFAMAHDPAFKVTHVDCLDDYPNIRDNFWKLLAAAGCRAYFCGHDHYYDHARIGDGDTDMTEDLHQFLVGTGGGPMSPDGPYDGTNTIWQPTRVFHEAQYGYTVVEVDGPAAKMTWHHRASADTYPAVTNDFSYTMMPIILSSVSETGLTLSWAGGGSLESCPGPYGPWTTVSNASSPYTVTNLSAVQASFYRVRIR